VFGGVHLLPFFHPIDGADAGFDPIDHTQVDPRLGDWDDIRALTAARGRDGRRDRQPHVVGVAAVPGLVCARRASPYAGLFLTLDSVFPHGATEPTCWRSTARARAAADLRHAGQWRQEGMLWTTFTPQQVDIDVLHPQGKAYLTASCSSFAASGIRMVRLDAVGYAIKKPGTAAS
jgi:sucrose phosphorylase